MPECTTCTSHMLMVLALTLSRCCAAAAAAAAAFSSGCCTNLRFSNPQIPPSASTRPRGPLSAQSVDFCDALAPSELHINRPAIPAHQTPPRHFKRHPATSTAAASVLHEGLIGPRFCACGC
ncbi:hypothetical protein COO60DRAFT_1528945 [Scenedesmus sp. NREL 46B-D3]|nr:hypothetical protein COO60DRAFT_1528945 [Scenedesmus sp. NREL 46B-D3]